MTRTVALHGVDATTYKAARVVANTPAMMVANPAARFVVTTVALANQYPTARFCGSAAQMPANGKTARVIFAPGTAP